jgi:hypothetical protein
MSHKPYSKECSCDVDFMGECVDLLGSNCARDYQLLECEREFYAEMNFHYPPLRCSPCRKERRRLVHEHVTCATCGREFIVRAMQQRWVKTNAPQGFDIHSYLPSECSRCRTLTHVERAMLAQLLKLKRQGHLTLRRAFHFIKTKDADFRQKILDGRLRPVDLAQQIVRVTRDGRKLYVRRYRGYTKTFDEDFNQVLWSYRKGGRMVHYDTSFNKVAETYWQPAGILDRMFGIKEGHYSTYNTRGEKTSETRWREPTFVDTLLREPGRYETVPRKSDGSEDADRKWTWYEPSEIHSWWKPDILPKS